MTLLDWKCLSILLQARMVPRSRKFAVLSTQCLLVVSACILLIRCSSHASYRYFMIAKKGLKLDGSTPTLLYGYGGFEISLGPRYASTVGISWLERGGVYVEANIRGG